MKKIINISNIFNKIFAIRSGIMENISYNSNENYQLEEMDFIDIESKTGNIEENKTVILNIDGVLEPRISFLSFFLGRATSTLELEGILKKISKDKTITKVILSINSPGGDISSIQTVANLIYRMREDKQVIAIAKDMAASAAYWIASAADKVILSSQTASVGSIGVVTLHRDFSKKEELEGVKTTEIYAGQYKRIASAYEPLSDDGKKSIQEKVDCYYSVFVQDVAKFRGQTEEYVLKNMAGGRMFIGEQAIKSGLADGFGDIDNYIYNSNGSNNNESIEGDFSMLEKIELTEDTLAKQNPELLKAIQEKKFFEGKVSGLEEGIKKGVVEGIAKERKRIGAIQKLSSPGFEKDIINAIEAGYTVEETGYKLWQAQKERGVDVNSLVADNNAIKFKAAEEDNEEEKDKEEEEKIINQMTGEEEEKKEDK